MLSNILHQYIDIANINININIGFWSSSNINININIEKLVAIYCQYIDRAIYCQFRAIYCWNRAIYCSLYGQWENFLDVFSRFFYFSRPIDRERQVRVYVAIVGNFRNHKNNSDPYLTKISTSISGNILPEQYQYWFLKNCNININIENPIDLYPWSTDHPNRSTDPDKSRLYKTVIQVVEQHFWMQRLRHYL